MTTSAREKELVSTFVDMADTLVADYDVIDLLHRLVARCAKTFEAVDAGILLPDETGALEVVASTSERSRLIGLLQLDAAQGPCLEAFQTGRVVSVDDIASVYARWPDFAVAAGESGYQSMHAIPLRLREETIGSLNLFKDVPGPLDTEDVVAAQGLADIATIGILHERALRESNLVRDQLQRALSSRVLIEQAKGVLAQTAGIDMEDAFERLRHQARHSGRPLSEVAQQVIDGVARPLSS